MQRTSYRCAIGFWSMGLLASCTGADPDSSCGSDTDCKGSRICMDGSCVETTGTGTGTNATTSGSPTGSTGQGTATATGGGSGSEPTESGPSTVCPYTASTSGRAMNLADANGYGKPTLSVDFTGEGALLRVDSMACDIDPASPAATSNETCVETYVCGSCTIELSVNGSGDAELKGDPCSAIEASNPFYYSICPIDCSDKECGDDGCGGECGSCQAPLSCSSGACVEVEGGGGCGTDCDCGHCYYCERSGGEGTCVYAGEGPYGCFAGCS